MIQNNDNTNGIKIDEKIFRNINGKDGNVRYAYGYVA